MPDKFELYDSAITWLMKNPDIFSSSRQRAFEIISKKICEVMKVERFGIWLFDADHNSITEVVTFSSSGPLSQGQKILRNNAISYFSKLDTERVIWINDAETETVLKIMAEDYLKPLNISALLDAPIFSDGERIGVVCCEFRSGPREWDDCDKLFAARCADFIGRMIEAENRHKYEYELKNKIELLEGDVHKKLDDLKDANLSLDLALIGAQAGKWDWDIKTGKLNLNKTWFTRLGYLFNELPQRIETFKKILHPDDVEKTFDALEKHLAGKTQIYECRYRMLSKTGEIQWCIDRGCVTKRSTDGTPLFVTGVNIDITPVVQLEQSLISSERQLKAMIRSLPAPVAMFDRNFRYLAYSSRWEEEWKAYGDIRVGKEMANKTGGARVEWMSNMDQALEGKTFSSDEDMVQVSDEQKLWLKWIIQPWKLGNGEIGGVVVMAENITERVEGELKIAHASKLSALGEMAGGIAHEINNPLSIIKGYIDLLKRHTSRNTLSETLMLQYIEKMDTTVERISRIVSGMRRFSRESSLDEKSPYSLNKIIDETLDICLERINNNGITLNVEYFPKEPIVECRSVEISQVLLNLINNSLQAIVSMTHPWIRIYCQELPDCYEIKVSDCGVEILDKVKQKLFQPFFTTKDIGVGTGLGLSISRGIIEEHRGTLEYLLNASHTTFVIKLPKLSREDN